MTANAFTSVSLDPPLVLVSIDHRTRMHRMLPDTRRYGVSVLASDQERTAWHFAGRPLRDPGELFEWTGDVAFVRGAIAHVGCSLHAEHEAGDHTLYLGRRRAASHEPPGRAAASSTGGAFGPRRAGGAGARRSSWWLVSATALGLGDDVHLARSATRRRADVRITAVEAIPFAVPYRRPARFASGQVDTADNVLVRVHTDAGVVGSAEAQPRPYTYGETQASIVSLVRDVLAPRPLVGLRPARRRADPCPLRDVAGNQVARAASTSPRWDAVGRLLGVPCSRLLGGFAAGRPRRPHAVLRRARRDGRGGARRPRGARRDHVQGEGRPRAGRRRRRGARRARGVARRRPLRRRQPGWSLPDAQRAGDALVELGVSAIEEPIAVEDHAGRRRLAERWSVPLVGDESAISLDHVERAIDGGEVRAISLKTARTGSTESRRILGLCLGRGVPIHVGSQYEGRLGALASVAFAAAHAETAVAPGRGDELPRPVRRPARGPAGRARRPRRRAHRAGARRRVDEDALHRYREDR